MRHYFFYNGRDHLLFSAKKDQRLLWLPYQFIDEVAGTLGFCTAVLHYPNDEELDSANGCLAAGVFCTGLC